MLTQGSTLEKAINHGKGRCCWACTCEAAALGNSIWAIWQNAWEFFPLHHYWGQHKGYLGCSRKCIVENNSTLMTDPGIYLGKAEAVALAHLICAVNGRQLSACFCYTCSCLQKFLRFFFFLMNKTIYPFTWQSCQCHNLNYHSDFPDGIFSKIWLRRICAGLRKSLNMILKSICVLEENKRQDAACAGMGWK